MKKSEVTNNSFQSICGVYQIFFDSAIEDFYIKEKCNFIHLNFLKQITNNCKIVFLTRKIDNLLKSGWWAWDVEKSKITITQFEQYMAEYMYIKHPDPNYCFQISYEDILEKNNKFESMFEFIGEKYEKEKIQKVLNERYSYRTGEEYGEETQFDCIGTTHFA